MLRNFRSRWLGLALLAWPVFGAEPSFQTTRLFEGDSGGYKLYRIPGIVVTKRGTILAYTEARRTGSGDWDSNGAVHFLFCVEYMRAFYMRSDDDGQTFSVPVEITGVFDQFRPEYAWRVIATGPGHGIQLRSGRLLVPVWLALGTGGNGHHPSVNATIYSDDRGATWRRGEIVMLSTAQFPDPNETSAVELEDGSVMLNVRTEASENLRTVVTSKDGATHWSAPRLAEDLPDPICFASMARLSFKGDTGKKDSGRGRILFVNPDSVLRADGKDSRSKDRVNLTVRLSYDEGRHWTVKRTVEPGATGYADLAVMPDGTILCLYEAVSARHDEMLGRFNLEWLTEGKDSLKGK